MARTATSPLSTQPLPGNDSAGTITTNVAAKLLMVTPEWVRRLTKDGWIAKIERGHYRVVDVMPGERNAPPLRSRLTQLLERCHT